MKTFAPCTLAVHADGNAVPDEDAGVSGAKGRDKRPGLDALLNDATRARFVVEMAWSLDRLGRSLADLRDTLRSLEAAMWTSSRTPLLIRVSLKPPSGSPSRHHRAVPERHRILMAPNRGTSGKSFSIAMVAASGGRCAY
jgi:hypothetical protein